jgi:hypothetical protein
VKRFSYLVALLLAGAALMAPSASADYTAYVGCSPTRTAAPATSCLLGDSPGAFFSSADGVVKYDVCVEFPSGERLCSREQEASQGTLYVSEIITGLLGLHVVEWFVDDELVASWRFELLPPPLPPTSPAVAPPASAPVAAAPPVPSPACSREKQRVKRLLAKLSQAQGKEAKAKVRPRLKAARAAVKRLC